MTLRNKIQVMQAFERGEEIESKAKADIIWDFIDLPRWDWDNKEYRIRPKPKQVVVIEKWLCKDNVDALCVVEGDSRRFSTLLITKVKLLDTYEVTI